MLINLIVQQPQLIGQIIQKSPTWVWALFAGLLILGASQLRDRAVGLRRAMLTPVAMTVLSVYGVFSAFGHASVGAAAFAAWLVAAVAVAAVALRLQPGATSGTLYDGASRCFFLPGSAAPMALILGIFLTKYLVGVELALQPALSQDGEFALQIAALYGVFNGVFAARALRLWRLARRSEAFATTPASA